MQTPKVESTKIGIHWPGQSKAISALEAGIKSSKKMVLPGKKAASNAKTASRAAKMAMKAMISTGRCRKRKKRMAYFSKTSKRR